VVCTTDPATMGLAGWLRSCAFSLPHPTPAPKAVSSKKRRRPLCPDLLLAQEAGPATLAGTGRSHWSIENGQHYRRIGPGRGPLPGADPTGARNLSLFRSLAIFLFKAQSRVKGGQQSLPTLSATFTANLGGSSADSPNADMRSNFQRRLSIPARRSVARAPGLLPRPPPPAILKHDDAPSV